MLKQDLQEPKDIECLMLKTPLKLVTRSFKTPAIMWFLMLIVYKINLMYLFPRKCNYQKLFITNAVHDFSLVYYDKLTLIYLQLGLFTLTLFLHIIALCKDPGYLKRPEHIDFMSMMKIFDPVLLCADCEVVRTDRSRHCSICNRCVERFDHHCPWINNCVGLDNHGVFMCFLTSMLLLLGTTLVSLILNFNCYKNFGMNRHNKNWFYEDLFLPDWMYGKAFIITVELVCILICSMFILLVL